jgi:adenylate kinase
VNPVNQRIVLLGPPASGKGTQADRLSEAFGIPHVSTGVLLRSECDRGTALGREADAATSKGLLVSDELAVRIVANWMKEHGPRFLFDGFPRTLGQAAHLDAALTSLKAPLDLVILLELSDEAIRHRILERISCLRCGATYSTSLHAFVEGDSCPRCGAVLVRRNDDSAEALEQRLTVYRELTLPVVGYYERTAPGIMRRIDAGEGSDDIFASLSALVAGGNYEG